MLHRARLATAACPPPAVLIACLLIALPGIAAGAPAQAVPRAEANQLHAAIANGDVASLRYWLTVRHADPAAPNAEDPDVTPLERCLGLAGRVLDAPAGQQAASPGAAAPVVGLRVLQDMVALLDAHGARLADADRKKFSEPVLRWFDDAAPSATPPPAPPAKSTLVVLTRDERRPCNGTGRTIYLVNRNAMSIRADVTTYTDTAGQASPGTNSDSFSVGPDESWRLGCDVSPAGSPVRYVLDGWR